MASGGWGSAYVPNPFNTSSSTLPTPNTTIEVDRSARALDVQASGTTRASSWLGAWGGEKGGDTAAADGDINGSSRDNMNPRERELARRESELAKREAELVVLQNGRKNWPPCKPMLYHDISAEVPAYYRSSVRFAYIVWIISALGFFLNWLIYLMFTVAYTGRDIKWFFLATIASVLGLPLSFLMWYRNVYYATKTDGATFTYIKTMFYIVVHIAWCVWTLLGIPGLGDFCAGIFKAIDLFNAGGGPKDTFFGVMCLINVAVWGLAGFGGWVVLGLAIKAFRAGDKPRRDYEARFGASGV